MSDLIKGVAGYQSGRAEAENQKLIQQQQKEAAKDRELDRARKLKEVLAANRASGAARGVVTGLGSEKAIEEFQFQKYDEDQAADKYNTEMALTSSRYKAKMAKRGANLSLLAGVAGTGESVYKMSAGG